jgi:hypothetical protein
MNSIAYPPWWHGSDTDAKISWLLSAHHARNYSEAASLLSRMRRPKRRVIDIERVSGAAQERHVAMMEERKLF